MRAEVSAYIGLGANLGDAPRAVLAAMQAISEQPGLVLCARSRLYASAPIDSDGPDYVNAVVQVRTRLTAVQLLAQLQALEQEAGRIRPYPNAPRTLDLDLLLYGDASIQSAGLTVPHPRMWQRAFVLWPLTEIAPQRVPHACWQRVAGQRIGCVTVTDMSLPASKNGA